MFHQCLTTLRTPPNTYFDWAVGSERAIGREKIVRRALERGSEWVWFVDDDHTFGPSALLDLMKHDVPVVGALYLQRRTPFLPIAMGERDENGWWPLDLSQCPEHGLVAVDGIGTGGLLVRTDVFHELGEPWFQYTAEMSEDLFFCKRVREDLGLEIYVDLDVPLGHLAPAVVFPLFDDGEWVAGLSFGPGAGVTFPILKPE